MQMDPAEFAKTSSGKVVCFEVLGRVLSNLITVRRDDERKGRDKSFPSIAGCLSSCALSAVELVCWRDFMFNSCLSMEEVVF